MKATLIKLATAATLAAGVVAAVPPAAQAHTTPVVTARVIVPAGPGCHFGVSANTPGIRSFKLAIKENPCGYTVRSVMRCHKPDGTDWHAGNKVYKIPLPHHPYYSYATCGVVTPLHIIQFGIQWTSTGKAPWNWFGLGPNPAGNHPGAPQGKCKIEAHGVPGFNSFRLFYRKDPCHYDIRAAGLCWLTMIGNNHRWSFAKGPGFTFMKCNGTASLIEPAGYQWKTRKAKGFYHFASIWPKPPANLK